MKCPMGQGAKIIFVPESNLGCEGHRLGYLIENKRFFNVSIMKEDNDRPGVRTTNELKGAMASKLHHILSTGNLYIHEKFFSVNNEKMNLIEDIRTQLEGYSRIIKPSKDPHKKATELYSGKAGAGFDDHVIALQLNVLMESRDSSFMRHF